jgi:hypothetical protein
VRLVFDGRLGEASLPVTFGCKISRVIAYKECGLFILMKRLFVPFTVVAVVGILPICDGAISDPVADFLERSDKVNYRGLNEFYLDDRVFLYEVDLNQDGRKEVLISSTLLGDGKQGCLFYVYAPFERDFECVGRMMLHTNGFYLGKIDEIESYGIVKWSTAGGGTGGFGAYIFVGDRIIETGLGGIQLSPKSMRLEGKGIEIAAKYSKFVSDTIHDQVEEIRQAPGYHAPDPASFVPDAQVIDAAELAAKYGVKVSPQTYQQAVEEELAKIPSAR